MLLVTRYGSWKGNARFNTMPRLEIKIFGAATDGATVYLNMWGIKVGCMLTSKKQRVGGGAVRCHAHS